MKAFDYCTYKQLADVTNISKKKNIYEKLRRMYQVHWFADISRKTVFRWKSHQTWTSVTLTNYGKYPEWNISVVN